MICATTLYPKKVQNTRALVLAVGTKKGKQQAPSDEGLIVLPPVKTYYPKGLQDTRALAFAARAAFFSFH